MLRTSPQGVYRRDAFDWAVIVYLALHIPTTLLVDGQCVLPASWYPAALTDLLAWHVHTNGDPFVGVDARPPWFRGIVWVELLLQVWPRHAVDGICWFSALSDVYVPAARIGGASAISSFGRARTADCFDISRAHQHWMHQCIDQR